ncbi:CAP domain-containing protein, partial [Pseudomonas syringae pv. tagetis]
SLVASRLGDWQAEGQKNLEMVKNARTQARQCGTQSFAATTPLAWNLVLGTAAHHHSLAMSNKNIFDNNDSEGPTTYDRAE